MEQLEQMVVMNFLTFLNGEKLNYIIEETGEYLIKIKQPDNSYLEKQITIE